MSFFGIPIRNSLGLGLGGVIPLSMRPSPVVPVLALDFVNQSYAFGVNTKSFSDVITFTRADATTCATRVNASGVLETVAANVPRFDYDPVTLALKGFLIEETRRNLLLNSAIAGTNLTTQSVTVTAVAHSLFLRDRNNYLIWNIHWVIGWLWCLPHKVYTDLHTYSGVTDPNGDGYGSVCPIGDWSLSNQLYRNWR